MRIGGAGVGKGTQCSLLAKDSDFSFQPISLGEVLREKRLDNSYREAKFVGESQDNHPPIAVPTQVANKLLKAKIQEGKSQGKKYSLLDGFPRSLKQIIGWEKEVSDFPSTARFLLTLNRFEYHITRYI